MELGRASHHHSQLERSLCLHQEDFTGETGHGLLPEQQRPVSKNETIQTLRHKTQLIKCIMINNTLYFAKHFYFTIHSSEGPIVHIYFMCLTFTRPHQDKMNNFILLSYIKTSYYIWSKKIQNISVIFHLQQCFDNKISSPKVICFISEPWEMPEHC